MWIGNTYIKESNVFMAEPFVQDCSYGVRINGIPIVIGSSDTKYTKEEKAKLIEEIINSYIRNMMGWK